MRFQEPNLVGLNKNPTGERKRGNFVSVDNDGNVNVINFASLVPKKYDEFDLTYVASGNGEGEIETVSYSQDSVNVATITLSYDSDNRLINGIRT